jgi:hypothetical protein
VTGAERPALHLATGTGREDPVTRRGRFEQANPDAVILPPSAGRWRAVFAGRTLGAWDLGGLMDQLEKFPQPARPPTGRELGVLPDRLDVLCEGTGQ